MNPPKNLYGFQGQEYQEETGWHQYKWRNADPALGRFFNVDPLAEKFYYNSTYAFSENHVTGHVELEGLEKAEPDDPARFNFMSGPEDRFLAIDQKQRLRGQISDQEFSSRLKARGVGATLGAGVAFGGLYGGLILRFLSNPINTGLVLDGTATVANAIDPNPNADYLPGSPLDDVGNLIGQGIRSIKWGGNFKSVLPKVWNGVQDIVSNGFKKSGIIVDEDIRPKISQLLADQGFNIVRPVKGLGDQAIAQYAVQNYFAILTNNIKDFNKLREKFSDLVTISVPNSLTGNANADNLVRNILNVNEASKVNPSIIEAGSKVKLSDFNQR